MRAGLQFPVGRIHRIIRHVGDLKQEVNNPGEQNPEIHLTPAEIAAVKAQALTKVKEGNFKHIASKLDVNQPTQPHGLGSIFVTPPNILKQQLTGYCTSPASSPMGRDNKHGWYEEHGKFVAIATRSLSSVLLVGDSLVNGLARYHRVWSKYLEPLRALNFGVGGDRTQNVLWRIENGEIPLNLQVAFVHCGTNNLDRDNSAEIRDGIASIVYTIQEKKPNANIIVSGLLPRDREISSRRDKIKLVNQKLMKWCRSGKVRNVHYLKPDKDRTEPDGRLVERYYFTDFLHLVEEGYEKFAKSIYEAYVKVSQGNVVDLIEDHKRSRSKSGPKTPPPKTQQKQNGQTTSTTFTTTVLPKPKPTATLPPPTAIAPKLKMPNTITSTLIPTIPPTTTSPLIMTTQPTATLPLTPTIHPTGTLTLIPTIPPTATLLHMQTTTSTLPPRALTTTLPPTRTIPPSLRPTTILALKHLPKCNRPINTPTRPTTVLPKPNPPARTPPTTTIPPIRTPKSTLPTDNTTHNNLTTQTDPTTVEKSTKKTKLFMNFLSLSILLLLPFTLLCLTNDVAFNVEFRDCKQSFLYHKRNLYSTNIFYYKRLQYKVFNNNVSILIHSLPISGIAYKLGGDFPSNNFTHKIHYKLGPEAHTIKLVFFPLLFLFIVTISNWIRNETFSYYTNIKHKYLFLKSRRDFRKHGTLFVFQKVLLFLLVVLTFDAKLPSRTQNDLNTAIAKDNELFTIQYITTADVIRSNHIKNQSSLYALTKLKFSKHHSYFKYPLILSGDINLHPGPVKYPCSVCAKPVRKRIISCEKCGLWLHKKCDPTFKLENNSSSICKPCQNKPHDNLDNVWVEFPFDDDFFTDKETASFDEKINDDAYKTDPVAGWKAFNKRGLHLIHLNINSL